MLNIDTIITKNMEITTIIMSPQKLKKPHQWLKLMSQNNKHWLKTKLMLLANNLFQFQLRTHKDLLLQLDQQMEVIQLTLLPLKLLEKSLGMTPSTQFWNKIEMKLKIQMITIMLLCHWWLQEKEQYQKIYHNILFWIKVSHTMTLTLLLLLEHLHGEMKNLIIVFKLEF